MIVDSDAVQAALEFLADDEAAARVHYEATKAENNAKAVFARLFLSYNSGPVAEREARATCHHEYQEAKEQEAIAASKLYGDRRRDKWAETVREIWRSEYSRATQAERVR